MLKLRCHGQRVVTLGDGRRVTRGLARVRVCVPGLRSAKRAKEGVQVKGRQARVCSVVEIEVGVRGQAGLQHSILGCDWLTLVQPRFVYHRARRAYKKVKTAQTRSCKAQGSHLKKEKQKGKTRPIKAAMPPRK